MTTVTRTVAVAVVLGALASGAHAQVRQAEHLTTVEFAALDRSKTAVIIPGGILEEHGPYLPSGSDNFQARWLADAAARRVAARPGWTALLLPMIPLGHSGANDIARQWVYPGSVTVRAATLRSVYMDLADSLGEHGFKFVFLVHVHGAPLHNQMLDQAADFGALVRLSTSGAWKGYWGAPAAASVALGAALVENTSARIGRVIDAVLDRQPWPAQRFFADAALDPADREISRDTERRDRELASRQDQWLKRHGLGRQ